MDKAFDYLFDLGEEEFKKFMKYLIKEAYPVFLNEKKIPNPYKLSGV